MKVLEQHLAFIALAQAVERSGEHEISARQGQTEEDLIGQRGTFDVAGAQAKTHAGCVGGNQSQAMPARHEAMVLGAFDEPVIEFRERRTRQLRAGLCEGLRRDVPQELGLLLQMTEERVKLGLNAHAHAAEQEGHQGCQRQLAASRKRRRVILMPGRLEKLG